MDINIKPLTPELADDFFDFFDNRAFTDHAEWSCCYCTYFHFDREREKAVNKQVKEGTDLKTALRNASAEFIQNGTLQGYLVYDGSLVIGFVNANDKSAYRRLDEDQTASAFLREYSEGRIKAVTCFIIAPEYRSKGIATAVLQYICEDAKKAGYSAVEGYPRIYPKRFDFPYHGPVRLYEKTGFVKVCERSFSNENSVIIMRKALGE